MTKWMFSVMEGDDKKCFPHGSESALRKSRRLQFLCEWHAKTCEGTIRICPHCGYNYCEYHMPLHRLDKTAPPIYEMPITGDTEELRKIFYLRK